MGLLRNYRWLKARDVKAYPKPDFAKKAATDAEISVCEALRNVEGVVEGLSLEDCCDARQGWLSD